MAMENWISSSEMHAIAIILNAMKEAGINLDDAGMKMGGDVLRIPMGKLKKAGYKFLGCDIGEDGKNFDKLAIYPEDSEESISLLAVAVDKVITEIEGASTTTHKMTATARKMAGKHRLYKL